MKHRKLFMILAAFAALGFVALVPSTGMAQAKKEICDNGTDDDGDKLVDCQDPDCSADPACKPPPKEGVCHNIGGPDAKGGGANCDPDTVDPCTVTFKDGSTMSISGTQYFGIVVPFSDNAIDAHINHGDGVATVIFDPPLHLASTGQLHIASNVECLADRVFEQPPEPGN